jgi:type IV pilus assembly protein PilC
MFFLKKISTQEKKDFVKTLALLIKSGSPINESFKILADQARSPILKKTLRKAQERTERGTPIYQVFEEDPNFEQAFAGFIKAGEESGTLDKNLKYLAGWLDGKQSLEREMSSATLYPKIILVFSVFLGGGLTFFVLPQLIPIFTALEVDLPLPSRMLLAMSNFIQHRGLDLALGIVAFSLIAYLLSRFERVREIFDDLIIKVPIVGSFIRDYQLTIISQLISTLFGSGLMVTKILDITSGSVSNRTYRKSLEHIKKRVIKGDSFSMALNDFPNLYPSIYVSIITTGEETGSFVDSFTYLADYFLSSITDKTKKLPVVLEPVILILIGCFVAFIASAIILPIYQVTGGFY